MFTSTDFVYAKESIKLIPGGESIGIKLNTGVYIAGKYQVDTIDGKIEPWRKSDIEIGDKIVMVDNANVVNNLDLINNINNSIDEEVILTIQRYTHPNCEYQIKSKIDRIIH